MRVVACEDKARNAPALEPNPYVAHVAFFAKVSEAAESVVRAHLLGEQHKSQVEGDGSNRDGCLFLCQEFEEVMEGNTLSSLGKSSQMAALSPSYRNSSLWGSGLRTC